MSGQEACGLGASESEGVPAVLPRTEGAGSVLQDQVNSSAVGDCDDNKPLLSPSASQFCEQPLPRAPGVSFFVDHGAKVAEILASHRELFPSERERLRASPRPLPSVDELEPEPYVSAPPVLRDLRASAGVVDLRLADAVENRKSLQGNGLTIDAAGAFVDARHIRRALPEASACQ